MAADKMTERHAGYMPFGQSRRNSTDCGNRSQCLVARGRQAASECGRHRFKLIYLYYLCLTGNIHPLCLNYK